MSRFTFEIGKEKLETYEWDNTWIDQAKTPGLTRVLYIGDSISCGTRCIATGIAEGKLYFDGFGSSKGLDNPYLKPAIELFAEQEGERAAVLFNNGLHGWHLKDDTEYKQYYEDMIKFLLEYFKETPVFIVLTTYTKGAVNERTLIRNKVALEIAEKYSLPVIDFYKVAEENKDLLTGDGVHFTEDGYKKLAKTLVDKVLEVIK